MNINALSTQLICIMFNLLLWFPGFKRFERGREAPCNSCDNSRPKSARQGLENQYIWRKTDQSDYSLNGLKLAVSTFFR